MFLTTLRPWNLRILIVFILLVALNGKKYQKESAQEQEYYSESKHDVDVQISYIDSPLLQIHWCSNKVGDADTVLVLTSKGTVYRSDDKGRQWSKLSEVFQRKALIKLEDSEEKVGIVSNIIPSLNDTSLVLFSGTEAISWISLDCGKSVTVIYAGKNLRDFMWHPTQVEWILASSWKKCPAEDMKCKTYKELLLSQDSGQTWNQLAIYVTQYSWGVKTTEMTKYIPQERILASFVTAGSGHQSLTTWNNEANLYYSDDFFETRVMSVASGPRFLLTDNFLFVAQITNPSTQEVSLFVSQSNGVLGYKGYKYDIIDADSKLKEHSYQILDTSENQVFMIVNHIKSSSPMGVIYISDSTGTRYSRSLENAVKLEQGGSEFHRVLGLDGIYLVNVFADEQAKIYENQIEEQKSSGFVLLESHGFKDEDLQKFKQTRITFDKGGKWTSLKAPSVDFEGKPIKCDPKICSLHLNLNQAYHQYGPIYSQTNSIGIIVATGSIGKYLSSRADQVNTYLSRDGGLNWQEIHKGSHIYEISNHGGLMIMASDQQAQKELKYSWNEGLGWSVFEFSDDLIEIQNIITEPTNKSTRFILYGTSSSETNGVQQEQGILITIDLDELHQRKCKGTDTAGELDSDYELWTPSGIVNPDCLFGKKVTYIRRKREAQCYNPELLDRVVSVEACPCSTEDYECDLGFKFDNEQQQCLTLNGTMNTSPPSECNGFYKLSSGYRKQAGNMCNGGLQKLDLKLECPGQNDLLNWLALGLVGLVVYYLFQNQDKLKGWVSQKGQNELPIVQEKTMTQKLMEQLQNKKGDKAAKTGKQFNPIELEENEKGLGYQEFDEDLLEKDYDNDETPIEIKMESQNEQSESELI